MKFSNFKKRLASAGMLAVMSLGSLGYGNILGNHDFNYYRDMFRNNYNSVLGSRFFRNNDFDRMLLYRNNSNIRVLSDQNFFMRHGLYDRYSFFNNGNLPDVLGARQVVLVDRDNLSNQIVLRNNLTGPFSTNLNRVVLSVPDSFYRNAVTSLSSTNNATVTVDTGHNTVSLNTIAGDLTTGDVSVDIMQ